MWYLKSCVVNDTNSTYEYNAANNGAVMFLINATMQMDGNTFSHNLAGIGGAIYG